MSLYLIFVWSAVAVWIFAPELGEWVHCAKEVWECASIIVASIALVIGSYGYGISGLESDKETTDSRD